MSEWNKKQVREEAKKVGMIAKWDSEWETWVVSRKGSPEIEHYYTPDNDDAVYTAQAMAKQYAGFQEGVDKTKKEMKPNTDSVVFIDEAGWEVDPSEVDE